MTLQEKLKTIPVTTSYGSVRLDDLEIAKIIAVFESEGWKPQPPIDTSDDPLFKDKKKK